MFTKLIFSALIISCGTFPLNGTVSEKEQNVVKREAIGDYFPDWVPFKNKHGDELGEFVEVTKKSKVKKRLALPASFILKALVDDGDEFEGGAADSDSEDYYEKKDWSDVNRPDVKVEDKKSTNHSEISDIDGVVNIITSRPEPIKVALESINKRNEELKKERQKQLQGEVLEPEEDANNSTEVSKQEESTERSKQEESSERSKQESSERSKEEESSEEQQKPEPTESPKPSPQEVKENEERKAKILSAVDELKLRHAEEQRQIILNDRRDNLGEQLFGNRESSESYEERERPQRRSRKNKRKLTTKPDYDEYDDPKSSLEDKYKFHVLRKTDSPPDETQEEQARATRTTQTPSSPKYTNREAGKLSVFRNPLLYVAYDDDEPTTQSVNAVTRGLKYSSKYSSTPTSTEDDRISLAPVKDGESTYFPKKRKNRRKKNRTTTPSSSELDSSVAETVTDNYKETTTFDLTAPDNTAPEKSTEADVTGTTGEATETTGEELGTQPDAAATNSDTIGDAVPASSDNKKEELENFEHKKGGGREHYSEHSEEHEEHGKKAYEGHHEDTKTAKGHHDKENHLGKYDDRGGFDKHHSEEAGHYGHHHHEESGKKHAQYEESGKHSKGHSTKGSHDIHKKEEYEKKVEFFEEEGDSGEEEKHGGYNHEKEHAEGGHFKHGKLKADHQHHAKGESGHFAKGGHGSSHKGHKQAQGHDSHGKHGQRHFQKGGREGGKKWIYHHGTPAKTANLVVIDRRGDQYYHGPHYYG